MVARNVWGSKSRLFLAARGLIVSAIALVSHADFDSRLGIPRTRKIFGWFASLALWILLDCFCAADMLSRLVAEPPVQNVLFLWGGSRSVSSVLGLPFCEIADSLPHLWRAKIPKSCSPASGAMPQESPLATSSFYRSPIATTAQFALISNTSTCHTI